MEFALIAISLHLLALIGMVLLVRRSLKTRKELSRH